jgi:hypothetical protein
MLPEITEILEIPNIARAFLGGTDPDKKNRYINGVYWFYYLTDKDFTDYNNSKIGHFPNYNDLRLNVQRLYRIKKIKKILM